MLLLAMHRLEGDDNTKFTLGYLKTNSNENTLWNNHKINGIGLNQVKIHIC